MMNRRSGRTNWTREKIKRSLIRTLVSSVLFVAGVSYLPYRICSRQAASWYDGDADRQAALGRGMAHWIENELELDDFHTGSSQFNGEWMFGTYMMAAMGYGQSALENPVLRNYNMELMEQCIERLMSPAVREFDRNMWHNDPIDSLGSDRDHHAAFLGYFNLVLGLHRLLDPASRFAELNDRITESLVRRIGASRFGMLESYPFEVYAVDNCAVIGSIGLHGKATGMEHAEIVSNWVAMCRQRCVDPVSGVLNQALDPVAGEPLDLPRGSGTALGIYMLAYADQALAEELYGAMRKSFTKKIFGFGGVREYMPGTRGEHGDVDSGPVVFGFGLSPTGFLIGGARLCEDRETYSRLLATAVAWGAPYEREEKLNFVTGASLGDAILFAMLTAPKGGIE